MSFSPRLHAAEGKRSSRRQDLKGSRWGSGVASRSGVALWPAIAFGIGSPDPLSRFDIELQGSLGGA